MARITSQLDGDGDGDVVFGGRSPTLAPSCGAVCGSLIDVVVDEFDGGVDRWRLVSDQNQVLEI